MSTRNGVVLVVIDMLVDFFERQPTLAEQRQALVTGINELTASFRASGSPVIWIRQEFKPDLSDAFLDMRRHGISITIEGDEGSKILPEIERLPIDFEIVKKRYSAFFGTGLDALLTKLAPQTLVLAGINSHACVRTTAIDAYQRDYDVILAADCIGSHDREHHDVSVRYLSGQIAALCSNAEIGQQLSYGSTMVTHSFSGGIVNGYNFTEHVRKVLALARDESNRLRHEYIGTEHLLLGLITYSDGIGIAALRNLGVDLGDIRRKIEETVKVGKADNLVGVDLPYTSRSKKVMELSMVEARNLAHDHVGTEHLLLGILREEKGIAAQILTYAGVTEGAARAEVRRLLGDAGEMQVGLSTDAIVAVAVEVRLANGSVVREEFRTVEDAIRFLNQH